jgi:hypothetical protein
MLEHNEEVDGGRELGFREVLFEGRDEELMHRGLAAANARRLAPGVPTDDWEKHVREAAAVQIIEGKFVERERELIEAHAAEAPFEADAFMRWFDQLRSTGPGQHDPFFDWLATHASFEQLRWTVEQEAAAHAGFEDLSALTHLAMPARARAELARAHFDADARPHAQRLAELAEWMGVARPPRESLVWEALALANLHVALALNRRYAHHSVGALAAAELAAPARSKGAGGARAPRPFERAFLLAARREQRRPRARAHLARRSDPRPGARRADGRALRRRGRAHAPARQRSLSVALPHRPRARPRVSQNAFFMRMTMPLSCSRVEAKPTA